MISYLMKFLTNENCPRNRNTPPHPQLKLSKWKLNNSGLLASTEFSVISPKTINITAQELFSIVVRPKPGEYRPTLGTKHLKTLKTRSNDYQNLFISIKYLHEPQNSIQTYNDISLKIGRYDWGSRWLETCLNQLEYQT